MSSLDKLSDTLTEEMFYHTNKHFNDISEECLKLIRQKGVMCYDYLDSEDKLKETELPKKECFYSTLNKGDISDEDYEHASVEYI